MLHPSFKIDTQSPADDDITICAIIAARNAGPIISDILEHLAKNRIDVIFVDNSSTDNTLEIISKYMGSPIICLLGCRYDGVYRWKPLLELKEWLVSIVDHDWVIHQDSDEILESPKEGESLRGFISRLSAIGVHILDCDEFVFVPDPEGDSEVESIDSMKLYYFHNPPSRSLHRIQRRSSMKGGWAQSGGHESISEGLTIGLEKARLRHYIGFSYRSLRLQYLTRVFDGSELRRGWHKKRVAQDVNFIVQPDRNNLYYLPEDGWKFDKPFASHLIFRGGTVYTPPTVLDGITPNLTVVFCVMMQRPLEVCRPC